MTNQTAAEFWGTKYFDASFHRTEWQAHPCGLERLMRLQGGMMRDDWFGENYLRGAPAERAIGVGVGSAQTEIALLAKGYVLHYDLYDVSPVGLKHAKETAEAMGLGDRVSCHCSDFSNVNLPANHYDLATFVASLHHMENMEETLWKVNHTLKTNGLLWAANEYIGPDRFVYPDEHLGLPRAFFRALPKRFRRHGLPELPLPTAEEVAINDPTESPCSSQILPAMQKVFPRLNVFELYGSFAFMVFWGLNYDALYESEDGADQVKMILSIDQALVDTGRVTRVFRPSGRT